MPPAPPPPPPIPAAFSGQQATAAAPEWKQELSERFEQFQSKRVSQRGLFDGPLSVESSEVVPKPDPTQKVVAFEDFAATHIEPVIVERPAERPAVKPKPPVLPPLRRAAPPAQTLPYDEVAPREIQCPSPVAPLLLRGLAGALDLAVGMVAVGVFFTTFHLLGGALHLNQKSLGAMGLAGASLVAFYFFLYTFYGAETPGLQWMGLRILDYDGYPPRSGQRLVRALGMLLGGAALGLGYLWAFVDEEGLTWHDRMSKTFITTR